MESKAFNQKLSGLVRSARNQRENVQELIEAGLNQYQEHGNTVYLTKLLNECIGVKSLPTNSIKEYVKAHANVKWVKGKDGMVFKKDGNDVHVTMPTDKWWEHKSAQHNAKPDMDVVQRVKSLKSQLDKAVKEGNIKEGQEEQAKELLNSLAKFAA